MMPVLAATAMTLGELLPGVSAGYADIAVHDLVLDSREVSAGAAFLAVPGGREHGAKHARVAFEHGAAVVLYEPRGAGAELPEPSVAVPGLRGRLGELARAFYWRDRAPPALFAVTGTNGKTTVAYLVAQALSGAGPACAYLGTLGYGVPPTLEPHALTTPDCMSLHRELRALATPRAALEASSHALAQDRLAGLEIRTAGFTNLSRDHLDHHGDLDRYAAAKARLFARPELEHAVLNVDDAFGRALAARPRIAPLALTVSLAAERGAALEGRVTHAGLDGLELALAGRYGQGRLRSPLIGEFNAENLLLALGVLLTFDLPLGQACEALAAASPAPGRMERIASAGGPTVIVDYAHTPAALERALASLRRQSPAGAEIWCVFGCGGERDPGKRAPMGAAAAQGADHLIVTDDNPRGEDPASIVEAILAGVGSHPDVAVEHGRAAAIRAALARARGRDLVLIAGKGHETTQIVGAEQRPSDDRELARAALGARA